jgi:hypothetical protein
MRPPTRKTTDFEKVVVGDFITGTISKISYDMEHKFKGFEGKEDRISAAVRFAFKLDGYEFPHYSRWMSFSLGEKSNLYKKYVSKLVANAKPDMDMDIDVLQDMKVKTIWDEQGDFQNLDSIYPNGPKIVLPGVEQEKGVQPASEVEEDFPHEDDDVPL